MTGSGIKIFFILSGSPMEMEILQKKSFEDAAYSTSREILRPPRCKRTLQTGPLSVRFRTSATNKTPLMDGKVFIGKDVDQTGISITVGDTTENPEQVRRRNWDSGFVVTASPNRGRLPA